MIKKLMCLFLGILMLAIVGCRSIAYNQNNSVESARKYLIAHSPELSSDQVAFVMFNKPTFLIENIFSAKDTNNDMSQICISWLIPEQDNVYMVFGVSELRMANWSPNRMIKKIFPKKDVAKYAAITKARDYALNNLYYDLSVAQYNHVRFADPDIIRTNFVIEKADKKDKEAVEQVQNSFVWECGSADKRLVICGESDDDLAGFKIAFGGIVDIKELKKAAVPVEKVKDK